MRPNIPITALKAWALAEVVMASVYVGAWRSLRFEAGVPEQSALITGLELAYLAIFFAAAALTLRWWLRAGQPRTAASGWAVLAYSLASIISFAAWDNATTIADIRSVYALDAAVSLLGLWPALALVALIRKTASQP
jgi:hypothetical protein